ncbi:MAG: mannitol dehydrogenase family protein [Microbacteriaceae bacterium]|nr:MAG: mannitol dehydrogenase family protein [Microbacteriaceae bacterium]
MRTDTHTGAGTDVETSATPPLALDRAALAAREGTGPDAPPVRIVHLGLGAFHRAHQAWYTAMAEDAAEWGIAAFTGRSPAAALELAPQDGLYTLIERSDAGDSVTVIPSIVEAVDGADVGRLLELVAAPATAIVTLTITEPGYRLTADGLPDLLDPAVVADIKWLTHALSRDALPPRSALAISSPRTSLGRLLLGLDARRRAQAGPIAIVPCDNVPENGAFIHRGLTTLAESVNSDLAVWLADNASFVSTSVDRITPKTIQDDLRTATELSGWIDRAPVVTEPFSDWVLQGEFPAGRPAWETEGARFVDDIEPFERRKLWLLNGAHSLLAYAGLLRGHTTVAAAINDPVCRDWVSALWDEDARQLPAEGLELEGYRAALLERFENARIEHHLSQIGIEGATKLRVRIAGVARAERSAGRSAQGCARAIGAWIALLESGVELPDAQSGSIRRALDAGDAGDVGDDVARRLLGLLDPELAKDDEFLATVVAAAATTV